MKLILSIYDHSVMGLESFMRMSLGLEKLFPFECLNINEFRYLNFNEKNLK